jgi:hypothetical protein
MGGVNSLGGGIAVARLTGQAGKTPANTAIRLLFGIIAIDGGFAPKICPNARNHWFFNNESNCKARVKN